MLQNYEFEISQVKGKENIATDSLSRRVDLKLRRMCRKVPD